MPLSRLDYRKTVASVLGSGLAHFLSSCCEWREAQVARQLRELSSLQPQGTEAVSQIA